MKKILFSLVMLMAAMPAFATVLTVCNMPYSPGQYTTFNAALAAASPNDTIYVHGSTINYGAIDISKSGIVVIGTGHNPNKQVPITANFAIITISASNVQIHGLTCETIITPFSTPNNVTIKRCKITSSSGSGVGSLRTGFLGTINWLIEGNIFTYNGTNIYFSNGNTDNTTIRNNIFNGTIEYNGPTTAPFTFTIANNLFLSTFSAFSQISRAMINNNIFYRSSPQGAPAATGNTMNHNISFNCGNNDFPAPGTGNLINVNPMFTSFPLAGALFDYSHDYNLAPGSPGIATGNDGTDRGVYGAFGYKFNMTGEPAIAEILTFTITSPTVIAPGGTLNISVTSKRIR